MQALRAPRNGVTGLTFSPDGDILAGIGPGAVLCWTRSRAWEQTGLRHQGSVTAVAFHPSGRTLAYAALNRLNRVTTAPDQFTGVRLYPLGEAPEFRFEVLPFVPTSGGSAELWLRGLAFAPDGHTLFSCHTERPLFRSLRVIVHRWDFSASGTGWHSVRFRPGSGEVRIGGEAPNTSATGWRSTPDAPHTESLATSGTVREGNSALVLAGTWGVHVCPLGTATGPVHSRDVSQCAAVAVAPAQQLVAAVGNREVAVWHLRDPNIGTMIPVPAGSVTAVALAPDGTALATGHADGAVTLWDPVRAERRSAFDFQVGPVQSLVYAPDGLTLAVAGRKGLVVFDTE